MVNILISSTSEDLVEHRKRVKETLERLKVTTRGMEIFGADVQTPVEVCMREVDAADLVVLVVAHRYGWVPRAEEGGDGETSITGMEYARAVRPPAGKAKKPVLAFIVDDKAPWTAAREQDRLLNATAPEDALEVLRAVQALKAFKVAIGSTVRDTFSTPDDLANKAGVAVANWLLAQDEIRAQARQDQAQLAQRALQDLLGTVEIHVRAGDKELALVYLDDAYPTAAPENRAAIADKRLEIASSSGLSLYDERLLNAARDVLESNGRFRALALLTVGKCKSQSAREAWKKGQTEIGWATALEAQKHLEQAAEADGINPDIFGTLGGLLKRMAAWAAAIYPDRVRELEDAMLAAYLRGSERIPHAYPLLNYIEQRALVADKRAPALRGRALIEENEQDLRLRLARAVKGREAQITTDKPWAAFDLARGRHYLKPNVPGFLEDLEAAIEEARLVARRPEDAFMVTTTSESLKALQRAHVVLEGLDEGIQLLERSVESTDWFIARPKRSGQYLERELMALRTAVTEAAQRQLALSKASAADLLDFINASELRWDRADETRFQSELAEFKRALQPTELKLLRGLWKIFGAKAIEAVTGGVPLDIEAAAQLAIDLVKSREKQATRAPEPA